MRMNRNATTPKPFCPAARPSQIRNSRNASSGALWSAWSALDAAEAMLAGEAAAYALCRPPGHHAFADVAGGFCFINNSAVAAQVLREEVARVAILDVDLHHGNGTQGIFYARPDVLTVSIHADPVRFYPFFWGHADERGEGPGLGYNLNLTCPANPATRSSSKRFRPPSVASAASHRRLLSSRSALTPSKGILSAGYRFRHRALLGSARQSAA